MVVRKDHRSGVVLQARLDDLSRIHRRLRQGALKHAFDLDNMILRIEPHRPELFVLKTADTQAEVVTHHRGRRQALSAVASPRLKDLQRFLDDDFLFDVRHFAVSQCLFRWFYSQTQREALPGDLASVLFDQLVECRAASKQMRVALPDEVTGDAARVAVSVFVRTGHIFSYKMRAEAHWC